MFKRLRRIGLFLTTGLLVASVTTADTTFWGGDITGMMNINPSQKLKIDDQGRQSGLQELAPGDMIGFGTNQMSGIVANNQYLKRNVLGSLGKAITEKQVINSSSIIGSSAGIQQTEAKFTVDNSEVALLVGNGGNIRFSSAQGSNPALRFNDFNQKVVHDRPTDNGPSMAQNNNYISTLRSPGREDTPLTLIAAGPGSGVVTFGGSISGEALRTQEFSATLAGGAGIYNGLQVGLNLISLRSLVETGTTPKQ